VVVQVTANKKELGVANNIRALSMHERMSVV
jgi:hypothetical protein